MIGLVLLVVPGLFLITIWAVIAPVIVLERAGVFESFGRSRHLVKGNGWQVFGVLVILFLSPFDARRHRHRRSSVRSSTRSSARDSATWSCACCSRRSPRLAAAIMYFGLKAAKEGDAAVVPQPAAAGGPEAIPTGPPPTPEPGGPPPQAPPPSDVPGGAPPQLRQQADAAAGSALGRAAVAGRLGPRLRVLAVVHQRDAGPGVFAGGRADAGHELIEWMAPASPAPSLDGVDAALVLGGAMNVDEEAEHPWLGTEKALVARAARTPASRRSASASARSCWPRRPAPSRAEPPSRRSAGTRSS